MNEVAADLRDLFASEIAKNKRLILEVERLQTQLYQSQQETVEWKTKTEKISYEADLSKREKSVYMKEIERLQTTIDTEKEACQDLKQQIKAAQLQWKCEVETNKKRIEELQHIVATFAKTTKDLESKLAVAERPPTQIIEAVNAVRSAAEEEIVARLSSQESYFQRRLELVKAEIEQYRKKYEEARNQAHDAELRASRLERYAKDTAITTSATSVVSGDKRAEEQSRAVEERSFSKSSEQREDEDAIYLLSPRPGSTPTDGSETGGDLRKHLQQRSTRARTARAKKQDLDEVLAAAEAVVSRPVSASQKELEKSVSVMNGSSSAFMKTSSYVGEGQDYFDSLFNNRKQVKFGSGSQSVSELAPDTKQQYTEQDASLGVVLTVAGPIRISCVHPDGIYVRIRNIAEAAEEVGGYLLIQLVEGKQVAKYRFPPSTCLSAGDSCTVWAGGYLTAENLKRLSSRRENMIWKDLKVWGAGASCTTVFAKPTGEALCWVHGALLDALSEHTSIDQLLLSLSADDTVDGRTTDSRLQVDAQSEHEQKPAERKAKAARKNVTKPEEASRRPKSPFHQHCIPDNRISPESPVTRRQSAKVRVDELDIAGKATPNRSESAALLSVCDTSPLVRPSPFTTHRKLIAQGLEILKAQHNIKFQPPMFNPRFPVPSN